MHYLGVDIGGTSIKAGLVDEAGHVLESQRAPTITDRLDGFLSTLTELVRDFQKKATIDAIGLGIPGLHNGKTNVVETSPNIACLKHVNVQQMVAQEVQVRTVSENDANAAAYAEFVCGAGVGLQHMAHLTLGTGLGSGLILNGSLFTGASGYGGEFGHTAFVAAARDEGRPCACGRRGCLEAFVSSAGMVLTAYDKMKSAPESLLHRIEAPLTSEKIYEAAVRGDAAALEVFADTGTYLGIACGSLMNLLNLEVIVIGGGVMASGETLLNAAREAAKARAFPSSFADCRIVQSMLWPDAGVIGAAMLARDRQ